MNWPSPWIELAFQAGLIAGEAARFVEEKMPLAKAYQYQQIWFARNGYWATKPKRRIAGKSAASYLGR